MVTKTITYKELFDEVTKNIEEIKNEKIYPSTKIEVETPDGWISVLGVMKKIGKGIKITTDSGKTFHGEEKHLIMSDEGWSYLKDVDYVLNKENQIEKVVNKEYTGETDFYDISLPPPHLYYSPNGLIHHNTFVVTKTIEEEGLAKNRDWIMIKGKITTSSLYQTLFMHRKNKLLVFDDTDSVWGDAEAANILKAALDSYDDRTISWISPRLTNVSLMSDEDKEKYNQEVDTKLLIDPGDTKIKLPTEFSYNGRIIFISNLKEEKFDKAVLNRSAKINMELTQDEIFYRMKSILEYIGDRNVPLSVKEEIFDFLKVAAGSKILSNVSMRTYVAAEDLYKSGLPNWKDLLVYA